MLQTTSLSRRLELALDKTDRVEALLALSVMSLMSCSRRSVGQPAPEVPSVLRYVGYGDKRLGEAPIVITKTLVVIIQR